MAMERKGERVGALEKFNLFTCLQKRAAAESGGRKNLVEETCLWEGIMGNHHESNQKWKSLSNSFRCRYVGKRPCRYPRIM